MSASSDDLAFRRSEVEAVADAVWSLFAAGLLRKDRDTILRAATASGVTVKELRNAALRHERGHAQPPTAERPVLRVVTASEPRHPNAPKHPNTAPASAARFAAKNPVPGMRTCSRCGELKPATDFAIKDRASGRRKSMCRPCMRAYQRERYLSVEETAKLGMVLRFIVERGDACDGDDCPDCGRPLEPGQEAAAFDVAVRHLNCLDAARGVVVV